MMPTPKKPKTAMQRDPYKTAACKNCGKTADPVLAGSSLCAECAAEAGMNGAGRPA